MKTYQFKTKGVCAQQIQFSLDDDGNVHDVSFLGGCNGNLKAIGKLIEGKPADEIASVLAGNDCGGRGTSCADQLSVALRAAMEQGA